MKRDEKPIGFSMALAQNPEAMQKFVRNFVFKDKKKVRAIPKKSGISA